MIGWGKKTTTKRKPTQLVTKKQPNLAADQGQGKLSQLVEKKGLSTNTKR